MIVALIALAACGGDGGGTADQDGGGGGTLTLAVMGPTTGDYANYGTDWENAVNLAREEINANSGEECAGYTIETTTYDDQADPQQGVSAANRLVAEEPFALIGPIFSSVTIPVSEVTERAQIPSFNGSSATEVTDRGLNYVFRMAFRDDQAGPFDAQTALEIMNAQTAVAIHDNTAFAKGLANEFVKAFEEGGGDVLSTEVINPGESDYTAVLSGVQRQNPDVVYYSGYFAEGGLLVKQGKELGLEKEGPGTGWLFGNSNFDPSFTKIAGEAAEGVLFGTWPSPAVDPAMAEYAEAYEEAYNQEPGALGHWGYDAVKMICAAITEMGGEADAEQLVDMLHAGEFSYTGVSGPVEYDEKGDRQFPPLAVITVENGEFTVYEEQPEVES
jgi:branched-chain amino acid transport system substrate-binding protein